MGDDIAIDALCLFGIPFEITGTIADFADRLDQGLAHLGGQYIGEFIFVGEHQCMPCHELFGARSRGQR